MPYIPQYQREWYEPAGPPPDSAGALNFAITALVLKYLGDSPNYQMFNDAVGALECAKLELTRRSIAPYEDRKAIENGDLDYPWKTNVE